MSRTARIAPGGMVFHVLNRGVGKRRIFGSNSEYAAFEDMMRETLEKAPMRICTYCLMPNHWHLLLWPEQDGELSAFMQRLTTVHATRWQWRRGLVGTGHLYQGRYKSFPVETDAHFYQVARYVERNALRANLVKKAEDWRWSSLWRRLRGSREEKMLLSDWPLDFPMNWHQIVNEPQTEAELEALRRSVYRGLPFGGEIWTNGIGDAFGFRSERPRGRPRRNTMVDIYR